MEETAASELAKASVAGHHSGESLFRRKYVIPFLLACIILACNQLTGINSIIGFSTTIFIQAGLDDWQSHLGYVILTFVNFAMTMGAVALVDRKGRKFLLSLGSAGIIASLICVGILFNQTEKLGIDCKDAIKARWSITGTKAPPSFSTVTLRRNCWAPLGTPASRSPANRPRYRSLILMVISPRRPPSSAPTTRQPSPSPSPAMPAYPQLAWPRSSPIPLPIWTPPDMPRSRSRAP